MAEEFFTQLASVLSPLSLAPFSSSTSLSQGSSPSQFSLTQASRSQPLLAENPEAEPPAEAAVIVLISNHAEPSILYTQRAMHLRQHPGEVCFPGGMWEPGDSHLLATAQRETWEEIGLPASACCVLGQLPLAHTRAGTRVSSFVASYDPQYPLKPSRDELQAVFSVPLAAFAQGIQVREDKFEREGVRYTMPVYHYQGFEIWGFTAGVTARLLRLIQTIPFR